MKTFLINFSQLIVIVLLFLFLSGCLKDDQPFHTSQVTSNLIDQAKTWYDNNTLKANSLKNGDSHGTKKLLWDQAVVYEATVEVPYLEKNSLSGRPSLKINNKSYNANKNGIRRLLLDKNGTDFILIGEIIYIPSDEFLGQVNKLHYGNLDIMKFDGYANWINYSDSMFTVNKFKLGNPIIHSKPVKKNYNKLESRLYEICQDYQQCTEWSTNGVYTNTSCEYFTVCTVVSSSSNVSQTWEAFGSSSVSITTIPSGDYPKGICGSNYKFYNSGSAYIASFKNLGITLINTQRLPESFWAYFGTSCITMPRTYLRSINDAILALKESYHSALITVEADLNNPTSYLGQVSSVELPVRTRQAFFNYFRAELGSFAPGATISEIPCSGSSIPTNTLKYCIAN